MARISYNVTGEARKDLAYAVGELMGVVPVYTGAGGNTAEGERQRFSYVVRNITVTQNGDIIWDDRTSDETMTKVVSGLAARGFRCEGEPSAFPIGDENTETAQDSAAAQGTTAATVTVAQENTAQTAETTTTTHGGTDTATETPDQVPAETPDQTPDTIIIELPAAGVNEEILKALLNSKNSLIDAALGKDCAWEHEYGTDGMPLTDLPIEFADTEDGRVVKFPWLKYGADSDTIGAWSAFLAAAVKFSKTAKRVTAKDTAVDNEKFAFRTFLVKVGLNDADNKWARKLLLKNLKGDSAFATPESKAKWMAKHGSKKNTEVAVNE